MPNLDTGHYFLTTLAPVKDGGVRNKDGTFTSHEQLLRMALMTLPTAKQSPATERQDKNSPFTCEERTHFCRFNFIDNVVDNGRVQSGRLGTLTKRSTLLVPQPVDRLNRTYLMFAADFDAILNVGDPLPTSLTEAEQDAVRDSYARELWNKMEDEIRLIYSNCYGFEEVNDADGFARYLAKCQVETTMPFNDYWLEPPEFPLVPPALLDNAKPILIGLLSPIALILLYMLIGTKVFGYWPVWPLLAYLGFLGLLAWLAVKWINKNGNQSLAPGRYADLPSVLKGLYLQQNFAKFAGDAQGLSDQELHDAFGRFLSDHQPQNVAVPTQPAGVIRSGDQTQQGN